MRLFGRASLTLFLVFIIWLSSAPSHAEPLNRVQGYSTYDQDFFYAAFVVHKPNLVGSQTAPFSDTLKDDSIGVFLQTENTPVGTQRTDQSVEMVVSAAGGAQIYRGANAAPLTGISDFKLRKDGSRAVFKYAVTTHGALNQPGDANTSYTVELAIPWEELGGAPAEGQKMRFNVVAFSAAEKSPRILSLSPQVKTAADVQNPSLWGEMVFVEAPVKSVASSPGAIVCSRSLNVHPFIDGQLSEGEWNGLTAFGFAASDSGESVEMAPETGEVRVHIPVKLAPSRPAIISSLPIPITARKGTLQGAVPHLVFARYIYEFQNDSRKALPLYPTRRPDGTNLIANHPAEGPGPWMSYDRMDWQRKQMEEMRSAGIDVAFPVFRADKNSIDSYACRGLITLAGALDYMYQNGYEAPMLGMWLDTTSLLGENPSMKIDLKTEVGKHQLYEAIRLFFEIAPARYCAQIPVDGKPANIVALSDSSVFSEMDDTCLEYIRNRFAQEFGKDLIIIGDVGFKGKMSLDGYFSDARQAGFSLSTDGPVRIGSVSPGMDLSILAGTGITPTIIPRNRGKSYSDNWKKLVASKPDWAFIQDWNDYAAGTEVAPSMEYGMEYSDISKIYSRMFVGQSLISLSILNSDIPANVLSNSRISIRSLLSNMGSQILDTAKYTLVYSWRPISGSNASTLKRCPLPANLFPGQFIQISCDIAAPTEPGDYYLSFDLAEMNKKGEVTNILTSSSSNNSLLTRRETVSAPGSGSKVPQYAISSLRCDLPTTMESGGTYTGHVTVRNDGSQAWNHTDGKIIARIWKVSLNNDGTETSAPVNMADASADIPADVPPGSTLAVTVPITLSTAKDMRLPLSDPAGNWFYQLRWEYSANDQGSDGAVSAGRAISLVIADIGAQFVTDLTPQQLPGAYRIPIKMSIRNSGAQIWRQNMVKVGYHWYYLDGVHAVWEDEVTPIKQDVEPGQTISDMYVWVTAPPNDGMYWLVWDIKAGETWASTLPSAHVYDEMVHLVQVTHGQLSFVDLQKYGNICGVTTDAGRKTGNMNAEGLSIPAELTPPYSTGNIAPSTLWMPQSGTGLDSSRKLSFMWGNKGDGEKNVVQCAGQKILIPAASEKHAACHVVDLLLTTTEKNITAAFTLTFPSGSEQYISLPFTEWNSMPQHNEELAWLCRYSRWPNEDSVDKPMALFRIAIRIPDKQRPVSIQLPDAPAIKLIAITLEK
jgi:hypothetical protein